MPLGFHGLALDHHLIAPADVRAADHEREQRQDHDDYEQSLHSANSPRRDFEPDVCLTRPSDVNGDRNGDGSVTVA
jgi:hypothetical protein